MKEGELGDLGDTEVSFPDDIIREKRFQREMKALYTAYSLTSGKTAVYSERKNIVTGDTEPVSIMKTRSAATALYAFNTSLNSDVVEPTTANDATNSLAKNL